MLTNVKILAPIRINTSDHSENKKSYAKAFRLFSINYSLSKWCASFHSWWCTLSCKSFKNRESNNTSFTLGLGICLKKVLSRQEMYFHSNSMHLLCLSQARSHYSSKLADYLVSAKRIQILWCFAELWQVNLKIRVDRSHTKNKIGNVAFCFQNLISINYLFLWRWLERSI